MANKFSRTFILRKLHQITGIVPLGIFFVVHMMTNAKAMYGDKVFNDAVADIHHLPFLLFIEIFGIFLPLLFHSVYGIIISAEARSNLSNYNYGKNWLYFFQRVTGIFLFVFIIFHLLHLRFGMFGGFGLTDIAVAGRANQSFSIVAGDFKTMWVLLIYILGVGATAWHFAYGLFLFAVDWGLVIGEKAQKFLLYGCVAAALGLFATGTNAAFSFVRHCGLMPQMLCEAPHESKVTEKVTESKRF